MKFFKILGTTALMASSSRHTGQIQSLQNQNLAPWPKTAFDTAQILFATFYFIFFRLEILELTAIKHLWNYLHVNVRNKLSFMNVLLQLLYILRQGFLTFCAMDSFGSLVKPIDPFSQKSI